MTLKRILLIAPDHSDISWPGELETVGQKHQVVALTGNVTQERVTRATTGQRFDVVHVASHSGDEGVQLSDGYLSKEQFAQVARHVRCDLVFFNSCNSARLGQYMIDSGIMLVIDWTIAVVDGDALRTASFFYDELAQDDDVRRAYSKVNPRDGSLCFLVGPGYVEDLIRPVVEQVTQLGQQTNALGQTMANLVGTVATQGKTLRWVAAAVVAAIVLALVLVVAGIAFAQDGTVPPVTLPPTDGSTMGSTSSPNAPTDTPAYEPLPPTNTPLPGCGPSGGQPKKCQTPTIAPTDTPVFEPLPPTATPEPPTATPGFEPLPPTEIPTEIPTATFAATAPPASTSSATVDSPVPTATDEPTATFTPGVSLTSSPTDMPTATETHVAAPTGGPLGAETPKPTLTRPDPDPTDTPAPTWTPTSESVTSTPVVSKPVLPTVTEDLGVATATPTQFTLPTVTPASTSSATATLRPTATKEYLPCY